MPENETQALDAVGAAEAFLATVPDFETGSVATMAKLETERDSAIAKIAVLDAHGAYREAKLSAADAVIASLKAELGEVLRGSQCDRDRIFDLEKQLGLRSETTGQPVTSAVPSLGHYIDPSASPDAFDRQVERARKAHTDIQIALRKAGR